MGKLGRFKSLSSQPPKMNCERCNTEVYRLRCEHGTWMCLHCVPKEEIDSVAVVGTMNFREYKNNNGNVSRYRVEELKRRALAPDGNGEVIVKTKFGKYTDKRATPL